MRAFQRVSLYGRGIVAEGCAPKPVTRFNSASASAATGIETASFWRSQAKKKKLACSPLLFWPPIDPPYCFRLNGGLVVSFAPVAKLLTAAAFSFLSRRKKNAEP